MGASIKNALIGLFVIAAFAIIVFILLFLHPRIGDEAKTLKVRFTDIDKVNIGTRVTYAGRPVGEVIAIEEVPDARTNRIDRNGDVYVYELTLKVDSNVDVFNTDEIAVRTSGLLGERNIAIDPLPVHPGQKLYLVEDQVIYATPIEGVEDTLKKFANTTKKVDEFLDKLNDALDTMKKEEIIHNFGKTSQNLAEITGSLNQPDKWKDILNNIHTLTEKANNSWTKVDEILENANQVTLKARDFTDKADKIITKTSNGEGTMGRLFVSDDLYLQLKSILQKGGTIADDITNYGLLYQSNKKWQRLNARRLDLVNRLSTPQEFNNYFNNEMNRVSTSLSKVSSVLDQMEYYPKGLTHQPNFNQKFAELLRCVQEMEDQLKMYNTQLVDEAWSQE